MAKRTYRHQWADEYKDYESNLAKAFSDKINIMGHNLSANAEYFATFEHPHLQQEMFKFCIAYIKELAKNYDEGKFDGRNEWACAMSKDIVDAIG